MTEQSEIVPGLGYLHRNDFYAEAMRLVPDAGKDAHIQIALSLSRARMLGEADGNLKAAADLELMVQRLRKGVALLSGKNRGAA